MYCTYCISLFELLVNHCIVVTNSCFNVQAWIFLNVSILSALRFKISQSLQFHEPKLTCGCQTLLWLTLQACQVIYCVQSGIIFCQLLCMQCETVRICCKFVKHLPSVLRGYLWPVQWFPGIQCVYDWTTHLVKLLHCFL